MNEKLINVNDDITKLIDSFSEVFPAHELSEIKDPTDYSISKYICQKYMYLIVDRCRIIKENIINLKRKDETIEIELVEQTIMDVDVCVSLVQPIINIINSKIHLQQIIDLTKSIAHKTENNFESYDLGAIPPVLKDILNIMINVVKLITSSPVINEIKIPISIYFDNIIYMILVNPAQIPNIIEALEFIETEALKNKNYEN